VTGALDAPDDAAAVKRDVDRLVAFSDGVFAIAITLLVLSIQVPDVPDKKLSDALNQLGPQIFTYALSFLVIGAYWMGHHRMFRNLMRTNRLLLWINLVMLGFVALLPLPTEILGKYADVRVGVVIYAAAISAVGFSSCLLFWYMNYADLNAPQAPEQVKWELIDDATAPLFFLLSIPIAFVSVEWAKYFWLLIVPANIILGKRSRKSLPADDGPQRHRLH
jgi:uncharacterized membrane protein